MHDRRIDGEPATFGNAGALFMSAMTWYDHKTNSIWSQPWGRAIRGPLKGVELFLLPSQVTTWRSWKAEHPHTLAMTTGMPQLGFRQGFNPDFVIGLTLSGQAKAYYYEDVAEAGVVNDTLGDFPVLIWAADNNFHAYLRQVGDRTLTFRNAGEGSLVDEETDSVWNLARGLAVEGPLKGQALQAVPTSTAYDWAWRDFHPESTFYEPQ